MGDLLLVTGDSSSDRYASKLIQYLKKNGFDGTIHAAAGYESNQAGAELVENVVDRAVVGLTEIVGSIPYFLSLLKKLENLIRRKKIDAVILMDFPGFNLRFAKRIRDRNIPLYYYITPQVWAWGQGRINKLKNWFEELFVIFPFEEEFFRSRGARATFVGHPLLNDLPEDPAIDLYDTLNLSPDKRVVSFFPGSRDHEIGRHLQTMGETAMNIRQFDPSLFPVISAAPTVDQRKFEEQLTQEMIDEIPIWNGDSYSLLRPSLFSVLASGTITMEATFARTPMIMGYKLSWITYWVGKFLVQSSEYAMPNLLHDSIDVPEYIQSKFTTENLTSAIKRFTSDRVLRGEQREKLTEIKEQFDRKDPAEEVGDRLLERL